MANDASHIHFHLIVLLLLWMIVFNEPSGQPYFQFHSRETRVITGRHEGHRSTLDLHVGML